MVVYDNDQYLHRAASRFVGWGATLKFKLLLVLAFGVSTYDLVIVFNNYVVQIQTKHYHDDYVKFPISFVFMYCIDHNTFKY